MNEEEAQAALAEARKRRLQACRAEMEAILAKYGCVLRPYPILARDGRIEAAMDIVIRPEDN